MAEETLALFQRRGHAPDAQLQAELVRLHGARGDAAAAEAAWRAAAALAQPGSSEAAALHAAWVAALARAGDLSGAVAALEQMLDAFASLLPVDTSARIREAAEAEAAGGSGGSEGARLQVAAAARWASPVAHMQAARNAVLRAAQESGDSASAKRAASLATLRGLPPDVGTYNALLRAALAHGDGLQAVLVRCPDACLGWGDLCAFRRALQGLPALAG